MKYIIYFVAIAITISIFALFYFERQKRIESLFNAMADNDISKINALLEKDPGLANAGSHKCEYFWWPHAWLPLNYATRKNKIEIANILISKGANVNAKDDYGRTALHDVQTLEFTQLLLSKGADISAKDGYGMTPLDRAVQKDHIMIAELLISKGANVNAQDDHSFTPLHRVKSKEMAQLLISKGAKVNAKDDAGLTPLHRIFSSLTDKGENKRQGKEKDEAFFKLVEFMISKGADVNARDCKGQTPLQYSTWVRHRILSKEIKRRIEELFYTHGAKE